MAIYSIVAKCQGCKRTDGDVCDTYYRPFAKWTKLGGCEGATHVDRTPVAKAQVRVGQQKQKKGAK